MSTFDGKAFGEDLVAAVKGYVDKTNAPIVADIRALRAAIGEHTSPTPAADTWRDVTGLEGDAASMTDQLTDLALESLQCEIIESVRTWGGRGKPVLTAMAKIDDLLTAIRPDIAANLRADVDRQITAAAVAK